MATTVYSIINHVQYTLETPAINHQWYCQVNLYAAIDDVIMVEGGWAGWLCLITKEMDF